MTELNDIEKRILRQYGAKARDIQARLDREFEGERPTPSYTTALDNPVRRADDELRRKAYLMDPLEFMRRFAPNWQPAVRVRPETLVAMQDAAASSTSVRGMNEPLPPRLNRAARRALRKKGKR